MNKKIIYGSLIILALAFYWLLPFTNLSFQLHNSSKIAAVTNPSSAAPIIEQVYILPSYLKYAVGFSDVGFALKKDKNTIVITGRNIESNWVVEGTKEPIYSLLINKKPFPIVRLSNYVEFEVDSSALSNSQSEIQLMKDDLGSNIVTFTNDEIKQQLARAQNYNGSPQILAVIPTSANFYDGIYTKDSSLGITLLLTGWKQSVVGTPPNTAEGFSLHPPTCTLTTDGKTEDCVTQRVSPWSSENLHLFNGSIAVGKASHEVTLSFGDVVSQPYTFDTTEFEQYAHGLDTNRNSFAGNFEKSNSIAGKNTSGATQLSIFSQTKDTTLPGLMLNVLFTLLLATVLRPWRKNSIGLWLLTFTIPVLLVPIFNILELSQAIQSGNCGDWGCGFSSLGFILYIQEAFIPLLESIVVAMVLMYSFKYLSTPDDGITSIH